MTAPHLSLVQNDIDQQIAEEQQLIVAERGGVEVLPPPGDASQFSDLGNAERFLAYIKAEGKDVWYVPEQDKWLVWSGTHWRTDSEDRIFENLRPFVKSLRFADGDSNEARRNAKRACDSAGISAIEKLAKRMVTKSIRHFDPDAFVINCLGGTINLRTGAVEKHRREDLITKCIKSEYDVDRTPERFVWFLEGIQPDPSVRAFIQRSIGYSLIGKAIERSFWILHGHGKNGKSIFLDLFSGLFGDYSSSITTSSIMAKRTSESSNDIARLKGKRLVVLPETDENERLNTALLKQMAAGDTVTARYLFQEFFDFEFTGKLWIATNHKPKIYDSSPGLWDRLKLIPFNTRISNEREIKRDELLSDLRDEWPAILAWAVRGCRDYFELKGFDVPEAIQRAIDEYRFEQDSIAQFLEYSCHTYEKALENAALHDQVEVDERDYRANNSGLFDAYKSYCKANNEYQYSQRVFTQKLTERGFKQKNSAGRYWEGVRLLES